MFGKIRFFSLMNVLVWGASCGLGNVFYMLFMEHLSLVSTEELSGHALRWTAIYALVIFVAGRLVRIAPRFVDAGEGLEFTLGSLIFLNLQLFFAVRLFSHTSFAPLEIAIAGMFLGINAAFVGLVVFWNKRKDKNGDMAEGWTISSGLIMLTLGIIVLLMHDQIFGHEMTFGLWEGLPHVGVLIAGIFGARVLQKRPRALAFIFISMLGVVAATHFGIRAVRWNHERKSLIRSSDAGIQKVILLTVDTFRYDMLFDSDENKKPLAPNLLKLAKESIVFHRTTSPAPWTYPSFCSMMTGLEPLVHDRGKSDGHLYGVPHPLPDKVPTMARRFRDQGWLTSAIVYNYYLKSVFSWDDGYDHYRLAEGEFMEDAVMDVLRTFQLYTASADFNRDSTGEITRLSSDWIREHAPHRYFMWIHYLDPHLPYAPPKQFVEEPDKFTDALTENLYFAVERADFLSRHYSEQQRWQIRRLYEAEVRYVDEKIGELLDGLRETGQYDDTLLIVTSDHGEEFWEHDKFEHGHSLHSEILHVPLIMKLPRGKADDVHASVSTPQLMATVLDLCDIPYDAESLDYPSLRPLWEDKGSSAGLMSAIWSGSMLYGGDQEAYTSGTMKLIHDIEKESVELYDLAADPGEKHNLAEERPEDTRRMRDALKAHVEAAIKKRNDLGLDTAQPTEVTPGLVKGLKKLGYM